MNDKYWNLGDKGQVIWMQNEFDKKNCHENGVGSPAFAHTLLF